MAKIMNLNNCFYLIRSVLNVKSDLLMVNQRWSRHFSQRITGGLIAGKHENTKVSQFIEFHGKWPDNELKSFVEDMRVIPNFITEDEESKMHEEVEPYMKRLRYEFDHWDDAIHGYRETERKHWYPHNRQILDRVQQVAFDGEVMPYVHVLDLDANGVIKPHVDSTRYCGATIAGISLLSDSVMRLVRTDEKKYLQQQTDDGKEQNDNKSPSNPDESNYRDQPVTTTENNFYADILLKRRSLYIMSHSARYNFTHEILSNENSKFAGERVIKTRRISIICRNEP